MTHTLASTVSRELGQYQTRDLTGKVRQVREVLPQCTDDAAVEALIAHGEDVMQAVEVLLTKNATAPSEPVKEKEPETVPEPVTVAEPAQPESPSAEVPSRPLSTNEKCALKLRKKLREIERIEGKLSSGQKVDPLQLPKLEKKLETVRELRDFEEKIAAEEEVRRQEEARVLAEKRQEDERRAEEERQEDERRAEERRAEERREVERRRQQEQIEAQKKQQMQQQQQYGIGGLNYAASSNQMPWRPQMPRDHGERQTTGQQIDAGKQIMNMMHSDSATPTQSMQQNSQYPPNLRQPVHAAQTHQQYADAAAHGAQQQYGGHFFQHQEARDAEEPYRQDKASKGISYDDKGYRGKDASFKDDGKKGDRKGKDKGKEKGKEKGKDKEGKGWSKDKDKGKDDKGRKKGWDSEKGKSDRYAKADGFEDRPESKGKWLEQGKGLEDKGKGVEDKGKGVEDKGKGPEDKGKGIDDKGKGIDDKGKGLDDKGKGKGKKSKGSKGSAPPKDPAMTSMDADRLNW